MESTSKNTLHYPDYTFNPGSKMDFGIGIIGAGWVVTNYQLPAYLKAGYNVVAVADLKEDVLKEVREKWGVKKTFTDYHEMLKLDDVDIVDICTQTFGRVQIVKDTARAGKHMLVQKPFTRSYKEGLEMVNAAKEAGVKLGINSHYRWVPAFRGAWNLIQQGAIGEPYLIVVELWGDQDTWYYYDLPERRWNAKLTDFMQVEWAAHHFDYTRFWAGQEPTTVYCSSTKNPVQNFECDMICSYMVEFKKNLRAYFILNQANKAGEDFFTFRIEGTEGVITGSSPITVRLKQNKRDDMWQEWKLKTDMRPGLPDTYVATMGDLMNAITEGREHVSSGKDNLNTVRAYLAGIKSQELRRPVSPQEVE